MTGSSISTSMSEIQTPKTQPAKSYLYVWDAYSLYGARTPAAEFHTHYSASITVSLDEPFTLETNKGLPREYRAVYVPPNVEHGVTGPNIRRIVAQIEPDCALFQTLGPLATETDPCSLDSADFEAHRENLARMFEGRLECEVAHELFHDVLWTAAGGPPEEPPREGERDPRIDGIVNDLKRLEDLPAGLTAGQLADSVGLSTERFRHLFKQEMGVNVRRYLLWLRIRRAGALAAQGVSLTEAAHTAGFYDSAHLSRTCKEMLGFPPSFLTGREVELILCSSFAYEGDDRISGDAGGF